MTLLHLWKKKKKFYVQILLLDDYILLLLYEYVHWKIVHKISNNLTV